MELRDQIKDELAAAYSLGIIEGERRALNRLVPEEHRLHPQCPAGEKQQVNGQSGSVAN